MEQFIKTFQNIDEHGKKSSLEEDFVKSFGTRSPISCHVPPIGQNIVITKTNRFSEKIPYHIRKSSRQHDSLYYQAQPVVQNHRQQYCHYIRIHQAS